VQHAPSVVEALAPCIVALVFGGIALYGLRTGKLPARAGKTVERRKTPSLFAFCLSCCIAIAFFCLYVGLDMLLRALYF
jgi:hypothetical protein